MSSKREHAFELGRHYEDLDAACISVWVHHLALSWLELLIELLAHGIQSFRTPGASITSEHSHGLGSNHILGLFLAECQIPKSVRLHCCYGLHFL